MGGVRLLFSRGRAWAFRVRHLSGEAEEEMDRCQVYNQRNTFGLATGGVVGSPGCL